MTQKQALQILKSRKNVFLTGSAGSGKTHTLNEFIAYLKAKHVGVAVTASTGIAATHMGGKTIHSFVGMGIKETLTDLDIKILLKKHYLQQAMWQTKVLIIDEISMLDANRLDVVNKICKAFKKNELPFGGMQVVLCGDFFQLPPVSRNGNTPDFVYKSAAWEERNFTICYLTEQHRTEDPDFLTLLNEIRANAISEESKDLLQKRLDRPVEHVISPTKLYTHNVDVDNVNTVALDKLSGSSVTHIMSATGIGTLTEVLKKNCLSPETLVLKKDAIVMFTKNNFEKGYVNGTLGKVVGFDDENYPIIQTFSSNRITATPEKWIIEENGFSVAEISQVPLRLAWAITVHKSQGMSLDAATIDLSKAFELGMGYVALSRVRTLAGIHLLGLNTTALRVNEEIVEVDKAFQKLSQEEVKNLRQKKRRT